MSQTPRLPVPDLAETCERYLKLVCPLLSDEAFEKTASQKIRTSLERSP